jgi:DNA-binding NtrC family response regulator
MERAVLLCADDAILPEDLPADVGTGTPPPSTLHDLALAEAVPANAGATPEDAERERIIAALDACAGNQTRAAEALNMPRRTLVKRLRQYDIPRPRTRPDGSS